MRLGIFLCLIFFVGCAHQPKEQPREARESKYFQENGKNFDVKKYPKPKLPMKAIREKQPGWCIIKFDILDSGKTGNVKILDCSKEGYFEEFCLSAFKNIIYDNKGEKASDYLVICSYALK